MSATIGMIIVFWIAIIVMGVYVAYISWQAKGKISRVILDVLICIAILATSTYLCFAVIGI